MWMFWLVHAACIQTVCVRVDAHACVIILCTTSSLPGTELQSPWTLSRWSQGSSLPQ